MHLITIILVVIFVIGIASCKKDETEREQTFVFTAELVSFNWPSGGYRNQPSLDSYSYRNHIISVCNSVHRSYNARTEKLVEPTISEGYSDVCTYIVRAMSEYDVYYYKKNFSIQVIVKDTSGNIKDTKMMSFPK